ncbi:metalloregulator ArsR/SmtB family transcription factor [Ignatzschineria sp. RMDPL8A]|uniref:metalloregulator ArsR/SmtB family transcription factor n=1 Tax=Ignatzschineria sp. RMDPL8A TaxID=2999236 RepID=UPI00168E7968|nr:metalloregulator ArsR/SmtB family transcription factor [Ignatzschineria sp. RMDPL8A]MDG9730256.1 metalloregulator ArsR/SmtB family transcription factor [Ignatzschineria sp. RMDPL8A]NLD08829.1 helix-turn-helix transcriptional regulator [Xanthomonadaceae bacterium]
MDIGEMRVAACDASQFLKSMSNEDRLMLLCYLSQGEYSVSELEEKTGIMQPTLSQQLGVLRNEDLVDTRRDGKRIFYSIKSPKVLTLLQCMYELFCQPELGEKDADDNATQEK